VRRYRLFVLGLEKIMLFEQARAFVEEFGVRLVLDTDNGLSGVAVGRKNEGPITDGKDFCVSAFVERKLSESDLRRKNIREFHELFNQLYGRGGPTDADVVELGGPLRLHAFAGSDHAKPAVVNTQKWFMAPRSGVSICNPTGYPKTLTCGTLGFVVEEKGDRYLVSNNHVLARENAASVGEDIVQPGTRDLNGHDVDRLDTLQKVSSEFKIAELFYFHQVDLSPKTNRVDLAIAKFTHSTRSSDSHARHGFGGHLKDFGAPYPVDKAGNVVGSADVTKIGRTSGYTEGYVSNVFATIQVDFAAANAIFVDQLAVRPGKDNCGPFSTEGDSGAALVNHDHEVVGLIFAGGPRRSLANPIDEVQRQLTAGTGKTFNLVT
jgi:hypothetical protein